MKESDCHEGARKPHIGSRHVLIYFIRNISVIISKIHDEKKKNTVIKITFQNLTDREKHLNFLLYAFERVVDVLNTDALGSSFEPLPALKTEEDKRCLLKDFNKAVKDGQR